MMTRRQAIKTTAFAGAAFATLPGAIAQQQPPLRLPTQPAERLITTADSGPFTLPPLPYAYDALEPHIDAQTMQIHHDKHHAAYVANLNKAISGALNNAAESLARESVEVLLQNLTSVPETIRTAIRNNGGGHYNHSLFWQMMKKGGGGEPAGDLAKAIETAFGNFAAFKDNFSKAALGQFGSGWAWLVLDGKELKIEAMPNQDSTISPSLQPTEVNDAAGRKLTMIHPSRPPLLGLDVWEHAYYLRYQNKRADYIAAWWNVVNWDFVAERYAKLTA
jgi:superoxide dismutase, Fe-Mn family